MPTSMQDDESQNVFICQWAKKKAGYEMRVDSLGLKVIGATFEDAEGEILDLIPDLTGKIIVGLEFQPAAPKTAITAKFGEPGIVLLSSNDPADMYPDFSYLYTEGVCGSCNRGKGERNREPMRLDAYSSGDAIFVRFRSRWSYGHMSVTIFSEDFINCLRKEEASGIDWIPVEVTRKKKKKYFEPISRPIVPQVMPAGLFNESERLQPDAFFCEECGRHELIGLPQGGGGIGTLVDGRALPTVLPSLFHIGQTADLSFCMPKQRWQEILGQPGTKNIVTLQVGVVKGGRISKHPVTERLPVYTGEPADENP